jgi:hypothetical protein
MAYDPRFPNMPNPPVYSPGAAASVTPSSQAGLKAVGGRKRVTQTGTEYDTQFGLGLEEELRLKEQANTAAQQRNISALRGLQSSTGTAPRSSGQQIPFDEEGARNAAFARAKDRAGQTARASLNSLREMLGPGGLGGARESQRTAEVMGGAAGDLGEFEREQLMQDLGRAGQISDRERAAGLTERGQDLESQRALFSLFNLTGGIY